MAATEHPDAGGVLLQPVKISGGETSGAAVAGWCGGVDEREAFDIAGLDRYQLQQELLELKVGGMSLKDSCELVRASGRLPAGIAGSVHFARVRRDVEVFNKRLQPFNPGGFQPPAPFELAIGDFVLSGNISHVTPDGGLLFYRLAKLSQKIFCGRGLSILFITLLASREDGGNRNRRHRIDLENRAVSEPQPVLGKLLKIIGPVCASR